MVRSLVKPLPSTSGLMLVMCEPVVSLMTVG